MTSIFESLSQEEKADLLDAIPYITILIAGADGNIDQAEKAWAAKIAKIRSYDYHKSLQEYYLKVGENFSERLDYLLEHLPNDKDARAAAVSTQLAKINTILPKLENEDAYRFYKGLLSFAEHVAKASGGFLGWGSISKEEYDVLKLKMITPIELIPTEEGDEEE